MIKFLNEEHKNNFEKLCKKDNTKPNDLDRKAMFYILAGNIELMAAINHIYCFENNWTEPSCLKEEPIINMSSGEQNLIRFALNLYNGFNEKADIYSVFCSLDSKNMRLCINAIELKYMKNEEVDPRDTIKKLGFVRVN